MGCEYIILNRRTGRWLHIDKCYPPNHVNFYEQSFNLDINDYYFKKLLWAIDKGYFKESCVI